jgi:hypothetical protein
MLPIMGAAMFTRVGFNPSAGAAIFNICSAKPDAGFGVTGWLFGDSEPDPMKSWYILDIMSVGAWDDSSSLLSSSVQLLLGSELEEEEEKGHIELDDDDGISDSISAALLYEDA